LRNGSEASLFELPEPAKPGQVVLPIMGKTFLIRLEGNDLGQLLDGLRNRFEAWQETAIYMETGSTERDDFIVEECRDADEARAIAAHYDQIIATIQQQIREQEKSL
jgi:hypothetical protein